MSSPAAEIRSALDAHLAKNDRPGGVALALDAVHSGRISIDELYGQVLVPLLTDTGSQWQSGSVRVWQEHFISAAVRTIIEALYPEVQSQAARTGRTDRTVVLACPPDEQHELGLRMLADRMEMGGWNAFFLGADTPVTEIAEAAAALGAELVVLSAATHYHRLRIRDVIDDLHARLPGARIVAGGSAFAHDCDSWPPDELCGEDLLDARTAPGPSALADPEAASHESDG